MRLTFQSVILAYDDPGVFGFPDDDSFLSEQRLTLGLGDLDLAAVVIRPHQLLFRLRLVLLHPVRTHTTPSQLHSHSETGGL